MPVKLSGKRNAEEADARIEIVPLIDIMFFLLAAFMLVSLSMVNLKAVKVNLPPASAAGTQTKRDFVDVSVDKDGAVYLDKKPVGHNELARDLAAARKANPLLRVVISGDKDARHGEIVGVLDSVRAAGVEQAAFEVKP